MNFNDKFSVRKQGVIAILKIICVQNVSFKVIAVNEEYFNYTGFSDSGKILH